MLISPRDLHPLLNNTPKPLVIDVRTAGEYAAVHIADTLLMPLSDLDAQAVPRDRGTIYLLCQTSNRANQAAETLVAAGLLCCVVEGGITNWIAAGLPVTRGRGVISIERQVRIGAGLLTLIGATLAATVHPGFIALPLVIGAGLTFAGITDWCGMGLALARAPWNRAHNKACHPAEK